VRPRRFIEKIRDGVVLLSLVGKRKLERTATRRKLDGALRDLGERYRELVRAGRTVVPPELVPVFQTVRNLEEALAAQEKEIEALEGEQPSMTT
jgi:hypothetical protein